MSGSGNEDQSVNDMMTLRVLPSARKHGIEYADIQHALDNILRYREQEYEGEMRVLVIGPDRSGRILELVIVPARSPQRVIHADVLRAKFYDYL